MIRKNDQIEEKNKQNDRSHNQKILIDAKDQNAQDGQDILQNEEVHVPIAKEEIHEGVDFPGSSFNVENREVGIENREQDDEEKEEKEVMAIEVNMDMGFSISPSPNRSTTPREDVSAEW